MLKKTIRGFPGNQLWSAIMGWLHRETGEWLAPTMA